MKEQSFEANLKKLEKIVAQLEDEKTDLDKSAELFEEGSALAAELSAKLKTIKFKVSEIKEKQGDLFTEEINNDDE
ncbi:Exonuclease VII small subunit [Elusimicrobium minutum Pei191]|uniref:Exodeoxyribonuclease 7 small subunit n=1 Tax=Elusimicrobium minutum (strain Pei191) TaxID=445932 RepID=EX7S_ELUMP|nr:exodeoxyribonuclease VII small subunit [Elusimicrobium minutum]B2KAR1.1 RecName: Full=Exodeoxyribonuclease 7 small subunit; AltName: Full=Exodeoxyribonuclease VII small subunit; Short=Exonuclease VII small subunit [Elusimicrobium minutum Pei191]ACC97607.1 Exonuclease VII small subunit [Elusimicrobium minutum Pei191]